MPLARIRPYNKATGAVVRRYYIAGVRFEERRGWYGVNDAQAALLKTQKILPPGVLAKVPVFDVVHDQAEAEALDIIPEQEAGTADKPVIPDVSRRSVDLTTADLPQSQPPEPTPKAKSRPKAKPKK